ncbi:hypothetical protein [uncultured Muribaculum sp.]|uniref:hypothetical protein n=1 Tax=uncultured Muribaculum sp. TaxID=1918613 RepID=UPI00259D0F49|nr:hypothetical protein [uncultured Muribaculum sp.]
MNDETLNKANRIRMEMTDTENMLRRVEKEAVIEISFNNGGYGCCSCQSKYLSAEEVATIKANITEQIRLRAQARLHELQKEFNNL